MAVADRPDIPLVQLYNSLTDSSHHDRITRPIGPMVGCAFSGVRVWESAVCDVCVRLIVYIVASISSHSLNCSFSSRHSPLLFVLH